jgi:hypothetical protein
MAQIFANPKTTRTSHVGVVCAGQLNTVQLRDAAMETEHRVDVDYFDAFLCDIGVEEWLFGENAGDGVVPDEQFLFERSGTFCSAKDTRTLAKIRKQARRQQFVSSNLGGSKRHKSSHQMQLPKLVAFPIFEKCDSLVFFPHTLSRLVNSGDRASLDRIFNSYLESSCKVRFCAEAYNCVFPQKRLLDFIALTWEVNPDYLMCVHDTKVVDNVISASTYFKYTECKFLTDSVRRMTTDPLSLELLQFPNEQLKRELRVDMKSEQEKKDICAVLDSGQDVVVYGRVDMDVTFDMYSKKIVALQFAMQVSSVV